MTRTLRIAALGVIALLLSGCMKMQMDITLHEDDTADGAIVFAIQKGLGESMGMSDEDLLSEMQGEEPFADMDGATVEPYEDEDYIGQLISFEAQPLDSVAQGGDLAIVRDGDDFVVSGTFNDESTDTSMLTGAEMTLSVTFPGEVSEHNGTLEGTTVTWDLLTHSDEISARGSASAGSSLPWVWILVGAGGLLVLAGVVVTVLALRKGGEAAPAAAPVEGAQPGAPAQGFAPEPTAPAQGFTPEPPAPAEGFTPEPERPEAPGSTPPQGTANPFTPPAPQPPQDPQQPQG